jgi:general secretion pathway protein F
MPVFEYTALDARGKTVSGIIDAESPLAARQKLRSNRSFTVSIKEVNKGAAKKEKDSLRSPFQAFNRIRPVEVAMVTRQLATLVGAGFPLVSALDTLVPQTKSRALNKNLTQIKDSIVEGNSFAGALSLYPGAFSPLYINMVRAGESSGTLEIVLDRLAEITEKQQALKNRIRTALAYPILMGFIGSAVLFLLLTFIVPSITSIFTDMNQTLPAPTRFLIWFSNLLKSYGWLIVLLMGAAGVGLHAARKTVRGRFQLDRLILRLPGFGNLARKLAVARFSRTLGSLLENGVSMMPALEIVKNIVDNVLISDSIEEAAREVGKGKSLGKALSESSHFPSLSIQMVQVGEHSGELEAMLKKVAEVYENEVETTILSLTALLEPVMILVMGVIVGFIVLSICLPIFEMNQLVR